MSANFDANDLPGIAEVLNKTAKVCLQEAQESVSEMPHILDLFSGVGTSDFSSSPVMTAISSLQEVIKPVSKTQKMIQNIVASIDTNATQDIAARMTMSYFSVSTAMDSALPSSNENNSVEALKATWFMCSVDKLAYITSILDRSSKLIDTEFVSSLEYGYYVIKILSNIVSASNDLVSGLLGNLQKFATMMNESARWHMDDIGSSMLSCLFNITLWLLHNGARGLRFLFRRRSTIPRIISCVTAPETTTCIREMQISFLEHAEQARSINLIRVQNRGDDSDASDNHTVQLIAA